MVEGTELQLVFLLRLRIKSYSYEYSLLQVCKVHSKTLRLRAVNLADGGQIGHSTVPGFTTLQFDLDRGALHSPMEAGNEKPQS